MSSFFLEQSLLSYTWSHLCKWIISQMIEKLIHRCFSFTEVLVFYFSEQSKLIGSSIKCCNLYCRFFQLNFLSKCEVKILQFTIWKTAAAADFTAQISLLNTFFPLRFDLRPFNFPNVIVLKTQFQIWKVYFLSLMDVS